MSRVMSRRPVNSTFQLETGNRCDCGGPVVATRDGRVLWFCCEPELPCDPAIGSITRITVRESKDCGASWGPPRIVTRGARDYGVISFAALQLRSGSLIHVFSRLGAFDGERFKLESAHRFANGPVRVGENLHWDAPKLFAEIKKGLRLCAQESGLAGIGVDTWMVER